jgi:hypothetical protein
MKHENRRFASLQDCPENPLSRPATIKILMTGQLLILRKQDDDEYITVGIPDFKDDHKLQITVYESQRDPIDSLPILFPVKILNGALTSDLWLDVPSPSGLRFSYERVVDDPSDLDPVDCTHDYDIQWLANFEASNFHNRTLDLDKKFMERSVFLTSGHFYNASKNLVPLLRKKGDLPELPNFDSAFIIGVNITLKPGSTAKLVNDDEPSHPEHEFESGKEYLITIINNPPFDTQNKKSDFKNYYRVIKGVAPSERFSVDPINPQKAEDSCGNSAAKEHRQTDALDPVERLFEALIEMFRTEAVPCVPGSSGFP